MANPVLTKMEADMAVQLGRREMQVELLVSWIKEALDASNRTMTRRALYRAIEASEGWVKPAEVPEWEKKASK